jgi:tetratricopeptide (TPR) repeat protein
MKYKYVFLIAIFIALNAIVVLTRKDSAPAYKLRDRIAGISNTSEWINTKKAIVTLQDEIARNPDNNQVKLKLAQAYIQEGRVTGDHSYYDALAFKLIHTVLKKDENNFEALCCLATLEASAHQFTDALTIADKAIRINPYNAYIYGVRCDALVELGNYSEAIKSADKMVSIRPDIRSYSRISYLREIHGDYPGAIDAMKLALSAGYPGLEQTEWTRVYLGRLYEITGDLNKASECYSTALVSRPNYAPALAGLGSVSTAKHDYSKAITFYTGASTVLQDYSYQLHLAELYKITGRKEAAESAYQLAQNLLIKHQHPTDEETGIGHNIDRELATVYISMEEYDKAYHCALIERNRRPANIEVNETLAWASYHKGLYGEAQFYILGALKTKSQNADLLNKAGLIFRSNHHPYLAQQYFAKAKSINPNVSKELADLIGSQNNLADATRR